MTRPLKILRRMMPDWHLPRELAFDYLPGGFANANYRFSLGGNSYVLRTPGGDQPYVDWKQEHAFYLAAHAVPTPTLVALDVDNGAMITEWVSGRLLVDDKPTVDELLSYLAGLHGNLPRVDRNYDPIALSAVYLARDLPHSRARQLTNTLTWPLGAVATCHNDLNPWNVIRKSDCWVTLDWEFLGVNDPLFDLVTLHQGLQMADAELLALSERYLADRVTQERLSGCLAAFWLREYSWAFAQASRGNRREEIETQLETAAKKLLQF
ncbi:MAG: phosphotransferase [Gammaproteobacteria bacterium]|nr:phosphotransferase [Gammaproteobacteria bacterium]